MSILLIAPFSVINKLEAIRRRFLWGGSAEKGKICWVSWEKIISPISKGGLGVGSLKEMNMALLTKWIWRILSDRDKLWREVIRGIHNISNKPWPRLSNVSISGVWNCICQVSKDLEDIGTSLNAVFSKEIRSGDSTHFWIEDWTGMGCFQDRFPSLFDIEKKKSCLMQDRISTDGYTWGWKRRPRLDAEKRDLDDLLQATAAFCPTAAPDKWSYKLAADGNFQVDTFRLLIDECNNRTPDQQVIVWCKVAPLKVLCFVWRANLGRIPTKLALMNRGITLASSLCPFCNSADESSDHILVGCPFSYSVFEWIFRWCGIQMPTCTQLKEILNFTANWGNCPMKREKVTVIIYGVLWNIWKSRNDVVFNNKKNSAAKTADNIIEMMGESKTSSRGSDGIKKRWLKATIMMTATELIMAGTSVSYKLASDDGMNLSILITYRYLFASILIFPLALFIERNRRPKLTKMILFQAFLCAVFGGPMAQNLYAESLVLTSATFATAFTNLIPPFTFIFAALLGLESVQMGRMAGKLKVIGTFVGVGGAMLLTFYKGHALNTLSTHFNILHGGQSIDGHITTISHKPSIHHFTGSVLALASSLSLALYLILQTKLSASYPCHYSNTFMISSMGFIQSFGYSVCMERSWNQWKLGWNLRLIATIFLGVASAITLLLITSSVHLGGPLFVSAFNPLMLVFVAITGCLVLDEKLHVGSVVGSMIIIAGLYMVLWGKSKEIKILSKLMPTRSSKDVNNDPNTTTSFDKAPSLFSIANGGDAFNIKSNREKQKEQEIPEEEEFVENGKFAYLV